LYKRTYKSWMIRYTVLTNDTEAGIGGIKSSD
jgi:uncharacterized protein with GYD domain